MRVSQIRYLFICSVVGKLSHLADALRRWLNNLTQAPLVGLRYVSTSSAEQGPMQKTFIRFNSKITKITKNKLIDLKLHI